MVCEHVFVSRSRRPILHADLDAFYASVEQRDDPRLRGRPLIVGAGVVLAASYEARAFGVRTAMSGAQARRLCPHAVVVTPRMSAYCRDEQGGVRRVRRHGAAGRGDVDRRGVPRRRRDGADRRARPPEIAQRLRRDVREQVGLPITVGVARTKFLAKVASGVAKPDGLLVVPPDGELAFLHPLPVERLWGVGPVTAAKLRERGITTVGQVARLGEAALVSMLGRAAGSSSPCPGPQPRPPAGGDRPEAALDRVAARAWSLAPVAPGRSTPSLVGLVDRVTRRMRAAAASAARSCCGCASTTSRARHVRTRWRRPLRRRGTSSPPQSAACRRRCR